jgi:PAS domain S-box-containing protein
MVSSGERGAYCRVPFKPSPATSPTPDHRRQIPVEPLHLHHGAVFEGEGRLTQIKVTPLLACDLRIWVDTGVDADGIAFRPYEEDDHDTGNHPHRRRRPVFSRCDCPAAPGCRLELQERLKEIGSPLPIVFLTGHGSIETSVQAIKAGAEDVLTKPVSKSTLVEAIERSLVRYRERSEQRSKATILTDASTPTDFRVELPGGLDARFCEVMDAAPVMIWVSDTDKQCVWFNRPWLTFTGRDMSQEFGNGWTEGVHPEDFDRCLETYVSHFDARKEFRMEYRLRRHDRTYRWIDDAGIPRFARDGSFLGYIGSCTDIHEYRETQSELRRRLLEMARLTRRADAAAIAGLFAHELNQPLAAILSNIETAELDAPDGALKEILVDVRRDNLRAAEIIRHMQNLLRSDEPEVQKINLNDVVCVVHEILKPHAAEVGVEMKTYPWQSMLEVRADPTWLQQVVLNLALNAMDATMSNFPGQRLIVLETHLVGQSKAGLSVSDTGTGIPAHQLASIFEPFASKRGGSGLGLSTSRGIVEAFGGKIWAKNQAGRGAVFQFTLPLSGA